MTRVLIVGANSILSSELIKLHHNDHVDVLYYSQPSDFSENNYPISSYLDLEPNYNTVYLVSAFISNDLEKIEHLFNVNVKLIKDICSYFISSKIIFFSSVAVYDGINNGTISEDTVATPQSIYGLSKLMGEKMVEQSTNYNIIRISSMYGIGMKSSTFLPKIVEDAIVNKQINILGSGLRYQNYIHVSDVAKIAFNASKSANKEVILAIAPQNHTNKYIADILKQITQSDIVFSGIDKTRSVKYFQKKENLNNIEFTPIEQGIKQIVEWRKNQF